MKKVAIFARVSTSIQDYERQVNELTALAAQRLYFLKYILSMNFIVNIKSFFIWSSIIK